MAAKMPTSFMCRCGIIQSTPLLDMPCKARICWHCLHTHAQRCHTCWITYRGKETQR